MWSAGDLNTNTHCLYHHVDQFSSMTELGFFFFLQEQQSPPEHQTTQDTSTPGGSDNSTEIVVNGNNNSGLGADVSGMSLAGVNGLHDDGSETSVELVIPKPQLNRSGKCKLT